MKKGFLYHADGVNSLRSILEHPIADKKVRILSSAERERITRVGQSEGLVRTDNENKIDDSFPEMVNSGKITIYVGNSHMSPYYNRSITVKCSK